MIVPPSLTLSYVWLCSSRILRCSYFHIKYTGNNHWMTQGYSYRLVQAKRLKMGQPRVPHATPARISLLWYHTDHHKQWKGVAYLVVALFVQDLGLALAAKTCPHRPQSFTMVRRFLSKQRFLFFFFFMQPVAGTQGTPNSVGPNIKSYSSPKVDPVLKLIN